MIVRDVKSCIGILLESEILRIISMSDPSASFKLVGAERKKSRSSSFVMASGDLRSVTA